MVGLPTPSNSPSLPAPSSSPSPLAAEITFETPTLLRRTDLESAYAVGLGTNTGTVNVQSAFAEAIVLDVSGVELSRTTAPFLLSQLPVGASSPFLGAIPPVPEAASLRANLGSYEIGGAESSEDREIELTIVRPFLRPDGEMGWLVRLQNPHPFPVRLDELAVVFRDARGGLAGAAIGVVGRRDLPASGNREWVLLGLAEGSALPNEVFARVRQESAIAGPGITYRGEGALRATSQGQPFVLGEFANPTDEDRWARGVVALVADGVTLAMAGIQSPVPLRPGEILPFAVSEFYGDISNPRALEVVLEIDLFASVAPLFPRQDLELSISQIEAIGSALFVRGVLRNSSGEEMDSVSVVGQVYSTAGELLTAGWETSEAPLGAGEEWEFRYTLPLPAGFDPASAEYDFRGFGLPN